MNFCKLFVNLRILRNLTKIIIQINMVRHLFAKTASGITAAAVLFVLPQSCVNEEYSLDKELDLTVSFGGDALVFPLGSTEQLTLKTLLSEEDFSYLTSQDSENGEYRFSITPEDGEQIDLSDEIPDLAEELNIDPITIGNTYNETINVDLSSMSIDPITFPEGDAGKISFGDLDIDIDGSLPDGEAFGQTESVEIAKYKPTQEQLSLDFNIENNTFSFDAGNNPAELKAAVSSLPYGDDDPIDLTAGGLFAQTLPVTGRSTGVDILINEIELAEGISDVRNISFADNAVMNVSVRLDNSFFSAGTVTPDIRIAGLGDIVKMAGLDSEGILDLGERLALKADGGKVITGTASYAVSGLQDMEWDGNILSGKKFNVSVDGTPSISFDGIATTKRLLSDISERFGIEVEISFENLVIDDMTLDVEPLTQSLDNSEISLDIAPVQLPEEVVAVNSVDMSADSELLLEISSSDLDISGLSAEIESLEIAFPEIMQFGKVDDSQFGAGEGFDSGANTLTLANVDLAQGRQVILPVASIIPGEPDARNVLDLSSSVTVNAGFSVSGDDISLKSMPDTDPQIAFSVTPTLSVADYAVEIGEITHEIDDINEEISIDLPEGIEDLGTIKVTPDVDKELTITIRKPDLKDIVIEGDGLTVSLPGMIVLKEVDKSYGYDPANNTLTFNGELPDNIALKIDYITAGPDDYDEVSGKYVAVGYVTVTGNARIPTVAGDNIVHKADIDALTDETSGGIEIIGEVPGIDIADCTVSLEQYSFSIDETQEIELFDTSTLPEGIESLSIGEVTLSDTKLSLKITSSDLDLGADPQLDIKVALPEEIVIENDDRVDADNVLTVTGQFENNEFVLTPDIVISKLDLSGVGDLTGAGTIMREVKISGKVYVENPEVSNPEDLNNTVVNVAVNGSIDPVISKITGKIGYVLGSDTEEGGGDSAMNEEIDLSGLPEFLKGENITLDFLNPHIKLDVTSNIGIPVNGMISIIPVFESGNGDPVEVGITIPKAESAENGRTISYWIADEQVDGIPANYTFVKAGIRSLLSKIPDKILLKINAETDADESFIVEPNAVYELKMDYEVAVPLEFGDQLNIQMDYTFPGGGEETGEDGNSGQETDQSGDGTSQSTDKLPEELGELLNMNSLGLTGSIESTLPLQLDMTLDLLDSNREIIPSEKISIPVKAGSADYPAVSPLDVVLKLAEGADGKDLSYIRMNFTVTSGNMSGEPVTESSYIKATLKAKVPGGVTIDLSSLGESEENTDNTDNSGNQN